MATKPTKRILDWASSGTRTDPGAAKEAAGWLTSDRPPAQWWNWVLSSFGDWLSWAETSIDEQATAELGFASITRTQTTPWNTTANDMYITYLPGVDHYYCAIEGTDTDVWDSADGITWSATKQLDAASVSCSDFVEKDGVVYIGVDAQIYSTSTKLVTNMSSVGVTFANITSIQGLVWDETNALWIAAGTSGANSYVETATAAAFPVFTLRSTETGDQISDIAIDQSTGITVITKSDATTVMYSANGTTWTEPAGPGVSLNQVHFNEKLGLWAGFGSTLYVTGDPDGTWYSPYANARTEIAGVISTPQGLLVFHQFDADVASTDPLEVLQYGAVHVLRNSDGVSVFDITTLGQVNATSNAEIIQAPPSSGFKFTAGPNMWIWPYDGYKLAYASF